MQFECWPNAKKRLSSHSNGDVLKVHSETNSGVFLRFKIRGMSSTLLDHL